MFIVKISVKLGLQPIIYLYIENCFRSNLKTNKNYYEKTKIILFAVYFFNSGKL
jgi:hypothetical protein